MSEFYPFTQYTKPLSAYLNMGIGRQQAQANADIRASEILDNRMDKYEAELNKATAEGVLTETESNELLEVINFIREVKNTQQKLEEFDRLVSKGYGLILSERKDIINDILKDDKDWKNLQDITPDNILINNELKGDVEQWAEPAPEIDFWRVFKDKTTYRDVFAVQVDESHRDPMIIKVDKFYKKPEGSTIGEFFPDLDKKSSTELGKTISYNRPVFFKDKDGNDFYLVSVKETDPKIVKEKVLNLIANELVNNRNNQLEKIRNDFIQTRMSLGEKMKQREKKLIKKREEKIKEET